MISALPATVFAAETEQPDTSGVISYTPEVNGQYYWEPVAVKMGESVTLSINDVTLDDQPVEADRVSYAWSSRSDGSDYVPIPEATSSSYQFNYTGVNAYQCTVTVDETNSAVMEFQLKENTLTVSGTSTPASQLDDEGYYYQIFNTSVGDPITLTVNADSTLEDANLTYTWTRTLLYSGEMPQVLDNDTNTCTFQKSAGVEMYVCEVSDGNITEYVSYQVYPMDTLTVAPIINTTTPQPFEWGYMYVAKAGEQVTMNVNAASTNGQVSYRWTSSDMAGQETELGTTSSLTVTKQDNDTPADAQMYNCYIQDGNEVRMVGFILFSIDPYQVTTEVQAQDGVPQLTIDNSPEDLSNSLMQEDLNELRFGATAQVTLTVDEQTNPDATELEKVTQALDAGSQIGAYLDLTLSKKLDTDPSATVVSELAAPVTLELAVPQELINDNQDVTRSYEIVRVHNGQAETLPCSYDAATGTVSFDADKFSTYVLAYKDTTECSHTHTQIVGAKDATCTAEGYTGDTVCKDCGAVVAKGTAIAKLPHSYQNGVCTVCGAAQPATEPTAQPTNQPTAQPTQSGTQDTGVPPTGDSNNMMVWIVVVVVCAAALLAVTVYVRQKNNHK